MTDKIKNIEVFGVQCENLNIRLEYLDSWRSKKIKDIEHIRVDYNKDRNRWAISINWKSVTNPEWNQEIYGHGESLDLAKEDLQKNILYFEKKILKEMNMIKDFVNDR